MSSYFCPDTCFLILPYVEDAISITECQRYHLLSNVSWEIVCLKMQRQIVSPIKYIEDVLENIYKFD